MANYSADVAQAIEEQLEEMEVSLVAFDEDKGAFAFTMNLLGEISCVPCVIKVCESDYTVIARCPVGPSPDDVGVVSAMAEFICRVNYHLREGHFVMDYNDGELRYKCFMNFGDQIPGPEMIQNSIFLPVTMMMRYAPGIVRVLYQGMDPKTAVKMCEEPKVQVQLLDVAKRAIDALLEKKRSAAGMDDAVNERAGELLRKLDDMSEEMLMGEISRGFDDTHDTEA